MESECARLKELADRLETTGRSISSLRADSWDGCARDRFDDVRLAMGKNWLHAADAHRKAAGKLHQYRITLEDVQLFSDSAIADARERGFAPAAVENTRLLIARWQNQARRNRSCGRDRHQGGQRVARLPVASAARTGSGNLAAPGRQARRLAAGIPSAAQQRCGPAQPPQCRREPDRLPPTVRSTLRCSIPGALDVLIPLQRARPSWG
ncbi:putative T7SS-secreted protein [Saccharopolyspora hirsuta]|uniref:putative T7SS-secreted protein n=1 Tax=Saccharopolyspora hirsuta TaxID=1837 RepID=UPI003320FCC2